MIVFILLVVLLTFLNLFPTFLIVFLVAEHKFNVFDFFVAEHELNLSD